ncbi:hypothetical protein J2I47_09040 [Fibrella sp. HMF5335]|uniref:DUF4347 domain-containing protein n=1 Tax=Fibrella rubiginis TaxID=2817060 RepID=A0A939GCR4_9BACT|nr:hypothetical protein [Fibrella rubiginis]MBO0936687.1 hypothetical protein [Fibrella rubiginis]
MDKSWIILTDAQFAGYFDGLAAAKIGFNGSTETKTLLGWVASQLRPGKVNKLYIMAHGISLTTAGAAQGMSLEGDYSLPEKTSGFGIMLGDTPIAVDNDHLFQALRGKGLKYIVLASCGIANGNNQGNWGDGRSLCQHIASYTGATVFASDVTQYAGADWTGNLYQFKPNQSTGGQLLSRPYPQVATRVDYE